MTKEDEELLMVDLCARLPYGVKVSTNRGPELVEGLWPFGFYHMKIEGNFDWWFSDFKPYLRPMSSMTKEERQEYEKTCFFSNEIGYINTLESYDWLNKHHFDYRGLIEKGLALRAPEGMYNK